MDSISVTSMNRIAEIGQPCLTSLFREKKSEIYLLYFTHTDEFVYNVFIHLIKSLPKLNFFKVSKRKECSKLSNAFSKYINIRIPLELFILLCSIMSWISLIVCPMYLDFTYAVWSSLIIESITFFIHWESVNAKIL